jgi:hypothetical protein
MNHDEIMERAKRLAAHQVRRRLARPVAQPDPGDENFEEGTEPSDAG